ncbi:MAG: anti-sigma factor [Streptosporangiaceae bacterium]
MRSCAEVRHTLGVYVLGAVEPAERAEVEAHLAECAGCRDELAALAGLPALLGRVSREEIERDLRADDADPGLLDRLLVRVAAERRRSRRTRLVAAAAVVALIGGLAGGLGTSLAEGDRAPTARPPSAAGPHGSAETFSRTDPRSHVSATVSTRRKAWGASLTTTISGVPPHTSCHLVVVGAGGDRDVAASWRATYRGGASVTGATSIGVSKIAKFRVVTSEGRTLLTIPVTS